MERLSLGLKPSWGGEEEKVVLALVIAFLVIMLLELNERFLKERSPNKIR